MATTTDRKAQLEARIEAQAKKLAELKGKKARLDAIEKRKAVALSRKAETRRLVLLGAFVNARLEAAGGAKAGELVIGGVSFSSWLKRDEERALFDLPPVAENSAASS